MLIFIGRIVHFLHWNINRFDCIHALHSSVRQIAIFQSAFETISLKTSSEIRKGTIDGNCKYRIPHLRSEQKDTSRGIRPLTVRFFDFHQRAQFRRRGHCNLTILCIMCKLHGARPPSAGRGHHLLRSSTFAQSPRRLLIRLADFAIQNWYFFVTYHIRFPVRLRKGQRLLYAMHCWRVWLNCLSFESVF